MNERFRLIPCPGGGATLQDLKLGQQMHSRVGPETESRLVYVEASNLKVALSVDSNRPIVVWDIGMGVASNVWAVVDAAQGTPFHRPYHIVSFELYPEGLEAALSSLSEFEWLRALAPSCHELLKSGSASLPGGEWTLNRGNFLEWLAEDSSVQSAPPPDFIFFDFYDPKSAPTLWSETVFQSLLKLSHPDTVLATYSAATWVRAHISVSGWCLAQGPSTGVKRETTLASPSSSRLHALGYAPLGSEWLTQVDRSEKLSPEMKERVRKALSLHFG